MRNILFVWLVFLTLTPGLAQAASPAKNVDAVKKQEMLDSQPYDPAQAETAFAKTVHGGVMHITAKSAYDVTQIKRIQAYLQKTASQFSKGDFSSTERFHGPNMPGLATLKLAKPDDIKYQYKAIEKGGQLHISTEIPKFLSAVHEWIDAQIADHGNTEIPGHEQHHASPSE
jgi:hypothetical protein